jgi:hypothetical protein
LQLHDEFFAAFVFAVQVKDCLAVQAGIAQMLILEIGQIDDPALLLLQQFVEKIPQQILVRFLAKQALESVVRKKLTYLSVKYVIINPLPQSRCVAEHDQKPRYPEIIPLYRLARVMPVIP